MWKWEMSLKLSFRWTIKVSFNYLVLCICYDLPAAGKFPAFCALLLCCPSICKRLNSIGPEMNQALHLNWDSRTCIFIFWRYLNERPLGFLLIYCKATRLIASQSIARRQATRLFITMSSSQPEIKFTQVQLVITYWCVHHLSSHYAFIYLAVYWRQVRRFCQREEVCRHQSVDGEEDLRRCWRRQGACCLSDWLVSRSNYALAHVRLISTWLWQLPVELSNSVRHGVLWTHLNVAASLTK